jgi:hypothetical protein
MQLWAFTEIIIEKDKNLLLNWPSGLRPRDDLNLVQSDLKRQSTSKHFYELVSIIDFPYGFIVGHSQVHNRAHHSCHKQVGHFCLHFRQMISHAAKYVWTFLCFASEIISTVNWNIDDFHSLPGKLMRITLVWQVSNAKSMSSRARKLELFVRRESVILAGLSCSRTGFPWCDVADRWVMVRPHPLISSAFRCFESRDARWPVLLLVLGEHASIFTMKDLVESHTIILSHCLVSFQKIPLKHIPPIDHGCGEKTLFKPS